MMKQIIILFTLLLTLISCSTTPAPQTNPIFDKINAELSKVRPKLQKCLSGTGLQEVVIYMDISSYGMVENITLIPWQNIEKRQCISMAIAHLRLGRLNKQSLKIRKVIQL